MFKCLVVTMSPNQFGQIIFGNLAIILTPYKEKNLITSTQYFYTRETAEVIT